MHIPDGVLSTPVWAALDAAAVGAVALVTRRAERDFMGGSKGAHQHSQIPLLGMMGAFVFAAQMVNFPVFPGVSGHLLGGLLASVLLGPWAGACAVGAVLIVQCLVFSDGGLTSLGANFINMGLIGSIGGYAIYAQRTNNPSGAANLPLAQTGTGSISSAAQSNSYTFSANANDVVGFTSPYHGVFTSASV